MSSSHPLVDRRAPRPEPVAPTTARRSPSSRLCVTVSNAADLVDIFAPEVALVCWNRVLPPAIATYLSSIGPTTPLRAMYTWEGTGHAVSETRLPPAERCEVLSSDLDYLCEMLTDLVGCPAVGVRLERVTRAMCPAWHRDRTGLRMLCTYQGPGTEWRAMGADDEICWSGQAPQGAVLLFKGSLWPEAMDSAALQHRSPSIAPPDYRTLATFDPLWAA